MSLLVTLAVVVTPVTAWTAQGSVLAARRVSPQRVKPQPQMDFFTDLKRSFTKLTAGDYDEEAVKAQIERDIARKPCIMYSTSSCPFCKDAKKVLDDMNAMYTNVELDEIEDGAAIRTELSNFADGRTSVPAVWVGGKFVGGCNDGGLGGVMTLHKRGELAPMLMASGSLTATQRI